ncbi:DUF1572 family protein [Pelagicoccus mobilis]|uniref:DUF1572 family protein n=1 Tax=Pelagicoccus mobilis TaxID=415221 RepID=A0A934VQZ0_9BACT|nr:DUF1572 family protein [Pelagicoccus mobilis]MBK1877073.1 DUF1572 family protein [Pelagicoccus mobilis]
MGDPDCQIDQSTESFVGLAVREFARLKGLADDATGQVSREQFFLKESESDNSIALICKHVSGNLISRWTDFRTSDGEKPNRNRDMEFVIEEADCYERLLDRWEQGWGILFNALDKLDGGDLQYQVTIRGESLSILQAICRQMTHYAYHVGQIVYIAKHHVAEDWQSLSIPPGKSAEFNQSPNKYIEDEA